MYQNGGYELHELESLFASTTVSEPGTPACPLSGSPPFISKEISRIRQRLIEKALTSEEETLLERYVQFHHKGLVALMDQVFLRNDFAGFTDDYKDLGELLLFIETNFEKYIDRDANVPRNHITAFKTGSAGILQRIELKLLENADRRIAEVLLTPLRNISQSYSPPPVTYRELQYLRQLQEELLKVAHKNPDGCTDDDLRRLMYYVNYNAEESVSCLITQITEATAMLETNAEKLERLSWLLKEVNQAPVMAGLKYEPALPSLKDQMNVFIMEELEHLERIRHLPSKVTTDHGQVANPFKLRLGLSVSQLGCLLKVLLQANIIQNENTAGLLRFAAKNCITKRSEDISISSLRGKFYDVEFRTQESVKQLLTDVIAEMKKKA